MQKVPPWPEREVGPDGPVPRAELPIRKAPTGVHRCDCCPGGPLNDSSRLFSEDHFARCLFDSCRQYHRNEFNPEVSALVGLRDWDEFVRQLLERGLIEYDDRQIFDDPPAELSSGLDICGFQQWLFQKLYAEDMRCFEQAAEAMRAAVHSVNISVSHRGLANLSQKELYTYQVLLSEYEHSIAGSLRQTLQRIRTGEQEFEGRTLEGSVQAARAAAVTVGKEYLGSDPGPLPTTPEDFQWSHGPEIERRLREIRVPSVGFPPRERVLSQTRCLRRLLGFGKDSAGRETEVEVLEIPWDLSIEDAQEAVYESNRMEALRQLALSKYFVDYLGFDFSSYSGVGLHFLSHKHGICLRDMIAVAGPLSERQSLFKYWAREILIGMRDYLYQCCQELTEDLTLQHVFISQEGLQLYFFGVPFGERRGMLFEEIPEYGPRNKWRNGFAAVEARLVTMFGNMILEMFYGKQNHDSPVRTLQELSTDMRAMISLAINARDTLDYIMLGGDTSASSGKQASEVQALAGGFVAAGIDEFNAGDEYKLWWLRKPQDPLLVLPNMERTADERDKGAALADDWSWSGDIPIHLRTEDDDKLPRMEWKPNARRCEIQGLLDHPALQWTGDGAPISGIMDAWDGYYRRYSESLAERGASGRL